MNYQKHYDLLIYKRGRVRKPAEGYYERHHIIPKSHGGLDNEDNLVYLTAREHFVAHWLLYRIYRDRPTAHAFRLMCDMDSYGNRHNPSSQAYQEAKRAHSKAISEGQKGKLNHQYGKVGKDHVRSVPVRRGDGVVFESISQAAKHTPNAQTTKISSVCKGQRNTHQGYSWEYV